MAGNVVVYINMMQDLQKHAKLAEVPINDTLFVTTADKAMLKANIFP